MEHTKKNKNRKKYIYIFLFLLLSTLFFNVSKHYLHSEIITISKVFADSAFAGTYKKRVDTYQQTVNVANDYAITNAIIAGNIMYFFLHSILLCLSVFSSALFSFFLYSRLEKSVN